MAQPIRFAIVGVRGYARTHLAYIRRLADEGKARLVAATFIERAEYPDVAAQLEADGITLFDDYELMFAACQGQVDMVLLPTPIHLHAPMTVAALGDGYHVLVEKPVAATTADVDRMRASRDAAGKQCAVGFQQIYSSMIQQLKSRIVEGGLGRVKRIHMMALWPRNPAYYARNNWAGKMFCDGQPVYDSPFSNALAHQIMNMLYLASPEAGQAAQPSYVEADLVRAYDIETFDTGCLRAQTDSGVEILFAASHACQATINPLMRLEAEKATIDCEVEVEARVRYAGGATEYIPQEDLRRNMFQNLIDVVHGQVPAPLCTLEIGRAHVACIEMLHQAAEATPVSPALVHEAEQGQRIITGVDEAVQQAFTTGRLFSELRAPFI